MTRREQPEQGINVIEREHAHPDCGCTLVRDEGGRVSLYQCATHEQAAAMLEVLRAWVESTARDEQTGSMRPVYDAARAILRAVDGA